MILTREDCDFQGIVSGTRRRCTATLRRGLQFDEGLNPGIKFWVTRSELQRSFLEFGAWEARLGTDAWAQRWSGPSPDKQIWWRMNSVCTYGSVTVSQKLGAKLRSCASTVTDQNTLLSTGSVM
jgi:hypothetical protein